MPFGIPTDIPVIPGLSGVVGTATTGVTEGAKAAITELTSIARSELFSNPMVGAISGVSNSITTLQSKLTQIASGAETNSLISSGDATTFLSGAEFGNLAASMAGFTAHTNRLSGILQGQGITVPGLEQITTVGKMMNNMANLIDGGKGCLNIIGAVTGLFSQNQMNEIAATINSVVTRINNGIITITEIATVIITVKDIISSIIDKDQNFLGQCVAQLKNAAFGFALHTAMSDPCSKFIVEQVGLPSFIRKLQTPNPPPKMGNIFGRR